MDQYTNHNIWIFAGTTEGRILAEFLSSLLLKLERKITCYVSTATEYGKTILENIPYIELVAGRKDEKEMEHFIQEHQIGLVIDATHPFAIEVTQNINEACKEKCVPYVRCLRDTNEAENLQLDCSTNTNHSNMKLQDQEQENPVVIVDCIQSAVEYLNATEGNILISTGSKELHLYTELPNYKERCYARVLSTVQAVQESAKLGFEGKHLIAMQGPFSEELNQAMLKQVKASYFVTKNSGTTGGFEEKIQAAKEVGVKLVVIARPKEQGKTVEEVKNLLEEFLAN